MKIYGSFKKPVWSPSGYFVACLREDALGDTLVVYSKTSGLWTIDKCSKANYFLFSPCENWLVVGTKDK